jgi:glutaminyl-peptide cyclotransferase
MNNARRFLLAKRLTKVSRGLVLVSVLTIPFLLLACPSGPGKSSEAPPPTPPAKSEFDGDRAFELVRKQVEFGPRPAGSAELEQTRNFMIDQLRSYGLKVSTDEFRSTTPIGERKMINVTAELPGESNDVVIISSHYDTKYFKDIKFVGANDAGSSTGAVMEMARVMAARKQKPKVTYWFVFFDGEEAFCFDWDECHNPNPADPKKQLPDHLYGSRRYVEQLIAKNELSRVRAMILLDMMGYKNLQLGRADLGTTWLIDTVWQAAKQLGYGDVFVNSVEGVGDDDHGPFLQAGVDSMDIIQLSTYGKNSSEYWHTKEDTLDKISAKSLKMVGDAVLVSLPKIEERLSRSSK